MENMYGQGMVGRELVVLDGILYQQLQRHRRNLPGRLFQRFIYINMYSILVTYFYQVNIRIKELDFVPQVHDVMFQVLNDIAIDIGKVLQKLVIIIILIMLMVKM